MRCSEVYRLRRGDLFLNQGFLKVTEGKTKSSIRNVHLSKKAKSILAYRSKKLKGDNIFPQGDVDFSPVTKTLNDLHLKTVRKLSYDFRLYDARHTSASRAVEKGVDLLTLADNARTLEFENDYALCTSERKAKSRSNTYNGK